MKVLQRTLAIVALLFLTVQTVRHVYVRWLEPRQSVLDRFDHPLKNEIAAATSVDELVQRYEPIRKEVDGIRAERAKKPSPDFLDESLDPFKSERELREAIDSWEGRSKEIHALRFYWSMGLLAIVFGAAVYLRVNRWLGVTLLIAGFSEMIYWTSPSFLSGTREFDRLLVHKITFSVASLILLAVVVRLLGVFATTQELGEKPSSSA